MTDVTPKTHRTGLLFDKAVFLVSAVGKIKLFIYISDLLSNPDKKITFCSPRLCLNGASLFSYHYDRVFDHNMQA